MLTRALNAPGNFTREPFWITRMASLLPRFLVVFRVRQDNSDIHELVVVPNPGDESIFVATDVEHGERLAIGRPYTVGVRVRCPRVLKALRLGA